MPSRSAGATTHVSQLPFDSDLLKPSLAARDDASGFDQPWNPTTLAVITFFFGLPAGGGLLAVNFRRLGMREWFLPAIAIVSVVSLVAYGGAVWYAAHAMLDRDEQRTLRFAVRIVNVLVALLFVHLQRPRFRLADLTDVEKGKLLWPAVLAIALGTAAVFAVAVGTPVLLEG